MNLFSKREAPCQRITRSLCAISAMALVAGCGGGGGGESADNPPQSATANATLSFDSVPDPVGSVITTYEATHVMVDFGARAHLADVGPFPESPGKGTTIMVIDDFSTPHASTTTFPRINRVISAHTSGTSTPENYRATYRVTYQLYTPYKHGELVSNIAGGYFGVSGDLMLTAPSSNTTDLRSCTLSYGATQLKCPTAFHTNAKSDTLKATVSMSPIPGVASEATMLSLLVDLSASQNAEKTNAAIHGHLINSLSSSVVNVINLSLGSDMPVSMDLANDIQDIMDAFSIPSSIPINAVVTIAAGNSSTPCGINYFGCNIHAMALVLPPKNDIGSKSTTASSTLVVGALTGKGTAQRIANYSTLPGGLAARFIYASGDTDFYGDAKGTSFAAPRVAGVAAIIKQKFPKLTSAQIASIILLSADRDMNNDGTPDFSGVDPVFGNGKLSLKNALVEAEKCFKALPDGCKY